MSWFTGVSGFLVGLVIGAAVGYCACLWWGKPARMIKEAADKGIDIAGEIRRRMR